MIKTENKINKGEKLSMKRKNNGKGIIMLGSLILALGASLTSCDVHQFPELTNEPPEPVIPDNPNKPEETKKSTISLNLQYFTDFTYRNHVYDSKTGSVKLSSQADGDTYDNLNNILPGTPMKVTVQVHKNNSSRELVISETFINELEDNYNCDLELEVPSGHDYIITAWGHLLDNTGVAFYDDSDFNSIKLIKETYCGNDDTRDAFRGRLNLNIKDESSVSGTIPMRRPMGKMEFIATGLKEYFGDIDNKGTRASVEEGYIVEISYPAYYPSAYTAMDDRLENSSTGYSFKNSFPEFNGQDEMSLGFDYIMINDTEEGAVQTQLAIYTATGEKVASTGTLTIPIQRDYHTVIRGNFLEGNNGGGIGIDPDFDGDFNIPMNNN